MSGKNGGYGVAELGIVVLQAAGIDYRVPVELLLRVEDRPVLLLEMHCEGIDRSPYTYASSFTHAGV